MNLTAATAANPMEYGYNVVLNPSPTFNQRNIVGFLISLEGDVNCYFNFHSVGLFEIVRAAAVRRR